MASEVTSDLEIELFFGLKITYAPMSLWTLITAISRSSYEEEGGQI